MPPLRICQLALCNLCHIVCYCTSWVRSCKPTSLLQIPKHQLSMLLRVLVCKKAERFLVTLLLLLVKLVTPLQAPWLLLRPQLLLQSLRVE
jgi:hypothetical protein